MIKYSANYSYSNHNFVIQNLVGERICNEYLPAICIIKNILQRGKPTLLSSYLQKKLQPLHKQVEFQQPYPLIDQQAPIWERIIRGDVKGNYYPAKKFIEELIPKHLPEYKFIQQLIIPEILINDITQIFVEEFENQQVDFYLPQAFLIIEIDGKSHIAGQDFIRDAYTAKYGIKTIRITTSELEAENESFLSKIERIKKRIASVSANQTKRKDSNPELISFDDYKYSFETGVNLTDYNYIATAVIRFQLLILQLLENGILSFSDSWVFQLLERDVSGFAEMAIEDLMIWFRYIFQLQKIDFNEPNVAIRKIKSTSEFSNSVGSIQIDFSILRRYTDEFQLQPNTIFIRTDYLDEYQFFKQGNAVNGLKFHSFEHYDYFKVSTTHQISYELKLDEGSADRESLKYLLWNLFLQTQGSLNYKELDFREGQLAIIANALSWNDTIGLLPTGSGKSVCYQLAAILQPAISFVVCPIKSLMYDQKADLDSVFFTRTNHLTSSNDAEERLAIQNKFGQGKYFFIFISPERFQTKVFRQNFSNVVNEFSIAYAVIDEVHCLSEWGHDFRTSYLNLANTIKKYCTNFKFLGLTATASINVLKNIQIEFDISDRDVKTPSDYTREELEFIVVDDKNNKGEVISNQLNYLKESIGALGEDETETKCGIIFTPNVNGNNGCHPLALRLSEEFEKDIRFYSGSVPKIHNIPIKDAKDYDKYKIKVQNDFKNNDFSLLTATKAFGMGVNKGNIHYTIHYGIPLSMEALYQEAGRAGRDKAKFKEKKAQCFVLLSKSSNVDENSPLWHTQTNLTQLNNLRGSTNGDINTNLFLFSSGLDTIEDEFNIILKLHSKFSNSNEKKVKVRGSEIGCKKAQTEKAIYRLSQLGIIEDWTITNFFGGGVFVVDFSAYTEESIKTSLLKMIGLYDIEFSFDYILSDDRYSVYKRIIQEAPDEYTITDKYILILLQWVYDHFTYNRRQSLKNIYEICCKFADGKINNEEFKTILENYFKFNKSSFMLQSTAENLNDYSKWLNVFYQVIKDKITKKLIDRRQQEELRDNLSRFLESYSNNTGLDIISGLVRLLLDDYNNSDGRNRLENSLKQIQNYEEETIKFLIEEIIKIGHSLDEKNKNFLAGSLYQYFNTEEYLYLLAENLMDEFSTSILISKFSDRVNKINMRLYDRLN